MGAAELGADGHCSGRHCSGRLGRLGKGPSELRGGGALCKAGEEHSEEHGSQRSGARKGVGLFETQNGDCVAKVRKSTAGYEGGAGRARSRRASRALAGTWI